MGKFKDSFNKEFGMSMANLTILIIILFLAGAFIVFMMGIINLEKKVVYGAELGTLDQMIDTSITNPYVKVYFEDRMQPAAEECVYIADKHLKWIRDEKGYLLNQVPIPIFLYSTKQNFRQCQIIGDAILIWHPKIVIHFNGSLRNLEHNLMHELNIFVVFSYIISKYFPYHRRNIRYQKPIEFRL